MRENRMEIRDERRPAPAPYSLIPEHYWSHFDDVPVGFKWGSIGRTITEYDVYFGMGAAGAPYHTDLEYIRKNTQFTERLLSGPIVLFYATCLISSTRIYTSLVVAFGGVDKVRAHSPVHIADTIRAYATVKSKRETSKAGLGVLVFDIEVYKQTDELAMSFEYSLMVRVDPRGSE